MYDRGCYLVQQPVLPSYSYARMNDGYYGYDYQTPARYSFDRYETRYTRRDPYRSYTRNHRYDRGYRDRESTYHY